MKIIYLDNELKPGMAKKELYRKLKIFSGLTLFCRNYHEVASGTNETSYLLNSFYLSLLEMQIEFEGIWW